MKNTIITIGLLITCLTQAQILVKANKNKDTYALINSFLAPQANVVETPDCIHQNFGLHITQEWDKDLNEDVFVFHIHVTPDNDRCKKYDRQRTEIKTYKKSPRYLIAKKGDAFQYKWKFKLDKDFLPSKKFTHLHQIKAIGGPEDKMPTITLTARKSSSEKLQVLYAEKLDQTEIANIKLSKLKGRWVQAIEKITYNEKGNAKYRLELIDLFSKEILLNYQNDTLKMWRTNAEIMRPKWGIYRSIIVAEDLKDEKVRFNDFEIIRL